MRRPRVLVVEDVPEERDALRAVLSMQDWDVVSAADGLDGIRMAFAEGPDLIVSDILMPELNGYHLCRFLKNSAVHASTPIVLLTGLGEQLDRFWGDQCGADLYLVKTGDYKQLVQAARGLLESALADNGRERARGVRMASSIVNEQVLAMMDNLLRESTLRAAAGRLGRRADSLATFAESSLALLARITSYDLAAMLLVVDGVRVLATRGQGPIADSELLDRLLSVMPREITGHVITPERMRFATSAPPIWGGLLAERLAALDAQGRVIGGLGIFRWGEAPAFKLHERTAYDLFAAELASVAAVACGREAIERKNRELLELNRMRDQLSELLVHDVKNAAFSVSLLIDALAIDADVHEHERALLGEARNGCKMMTDLMVGLLDVNKLEEARLSLRAGPLDCEQIARQAVGLYEGRARRRGLEIKIGGLPAAHGDGDLLRRVLSNLAGNAVKHTQTGGITVEGEPSSSTDGHPMVTLSVRDTGPGVAPEIAGRLFQKYATVSPAGGGPGSAGAGSIDRGLGLYFCRLAVEAHGGRIWVESEPGKGSTFRFTLPADAAAFEELARRGE